MYKIGKLSTGLTGGDKQKYTYEAQTQTSANVGDMKRWGKMMPAQRTLYQIYFTCGNGECQEFLHKNAEKKPVFWTTETKPKESWEIAAGFRIDKKKTPW